MTDKRKIDLVSLIIAGIMVIAAFLLLGALGVTLAHTSPLNFFVGLFVAALLGGLFGGVVAAFGQKTGWWIWKRDGS